MDRRRFLSRTSLSVAAAASGILGLTNEKQAALPELGQTSVHSLAGQTFSSDQLRKLKTQYEKDLYEDFLPFMNKYVIDHEYGGFMCNTDVDGTNITQDKSSWYEGRGIWVYSFLYNHLLKDPKILEIAKKSVEFIMKHKPAGDELWPSAYSREGKVKGQPDKRGYGDLFIAGGLAEYARATQDDTFYELAKEIMAKVIRLYDREDYCPEAGPSYLGPSLPSTPGARVLGVWMVLLNTATQMLEYKKDAYAESVANRALEAIMDYHYNPEFDLFNEILNHDLSRPQNDYAQFCYTGHAIETLWMVLYEAARRRDKNLFESGAKRFKRHIEVAWDDVYGGAFRSLDHIDKNIWKVDKVLWLQEEILIGTMFIVEHTGAAWAREMFFRTYEYVNDKFNLKRYGYTYWLSASDRKVTFSGHSNRVENFHHPRHLMLNLLSIQRMIERKGKIAGFQGWK